MQLGTIIVSYHHIELITLYHYIKLNKLEFMFSLLQVNQLARINLALTAEADVGGGTLTAAGIATQLNLIENAINMINAPTCA